MSECGRSAQASLVRDLLREHLLYGGGSRGRRLPQEYALSRELGCSRNVLREALGLLVADGLIQRERGRGTHVLTTSPAISIDQGMDLAAAMLEEIPPLRAAPAVSYRVLRIGAAPAPALLADLLGVRPGTPVWHVERLVEIDGHRVGHWDAHIVAPEPPPSPPVPAPGAPVPAPGAPVPAPGAPVPAPGAPAAPPAALAALARDTMAESLLRALGLRPDHEDVRVEAITPSPRTARLLYQGERDQPTLRMSRRFYDDHEAVLALFIGRCALPGGAFSVTRRCVATP